MIMHFFVIALEISKFLAVLAFAIEYRKRKVRNITIYHVRSMQNKMIWGNTLNMMKKYVLYMNRIERNKIFFDVTCHYCRVLQKTQRRGK